MSFKYGAPWNIWLFLFSAVVAIFALLGPKMEAKSYRITRNLLFLLFVASITFYAFVNMVALEVLGVGMLGRLAFIVSVGSPLVMLVCFVSVRWACVLMWTLFLFVHSWYVAINWPSIYGVIMALSFDWALWTSALFLLVVAVQDSRRLRIHSALNPIAESTC